MSLRTEPRLPKLPFVFADLVLLGVGYLIFWRSQASMTPWEMFFCAASVGLGAVLCVSPFLLEYRAAIKLNEADRLSQAILQIENIEIIGRQISHATANWQAAHEQANKTVEAAREIAERITGEAQSFTEFLKKANDNEKSHLRLEVDKLRRVESEWLQILVRILDHIFALNQAAARSGQTPLVRQLAQFQNACRDIARRVGLAPFVALSGEPYDSKVHQLADATLVPAAAARIAETLATGYSFQGQLVRPALVSLQTETAADQANATAKPEGKIRASEVQPNGAEADAGFDAQPEIPQCDPEAAESSPQRVEPESRDAGQAQSRS